MGLSCFGRRGAPHRDCYLAAARGTVWRWLRHVGRPFAIALAAPFTISSPRGIFPRGRHRISPPAAGDASLMMLAKMRQAVLPGGRRSRSIIEDPDL
jgi:hypothetical protein